MGRPARLWIGASLRAAVWRYEYEPADDRDSVFALEVQARVGFDWFPRDGRFYINRQIGIAVPLPVGDRPSAGAQTHPRLSPYPVPALHLGWRF